MPPFRKPSLVTLRRQDLSQPWGFRLIGGSNQGQPFAVQKVTPESIAYKSGLREGDELVRIGNIALRGLTHEEVQEIILRCSNTIDLFVIRKDEENSQNETEEQQNIFNAQHNSPINPKTHSIKSNQSFTEQVISESAYYTNSLDFNDPISGPLQEFYVKEKESYQFKNYESLPMSKRPQSPYQKPPQSARPFSPTNRPFSPTTPSSSAISYHQAEEQQWLSTGDQPRDTRVFGLNPRSRSSSPSPIPRYQRPNEQQWPSPTPEQKRDDGVFGSKSLSSSQSPVPENQKMNEQQWSSNLGESQRVFGSSPRPASSPTHASDTVNQSNESAINYSYGNQRAPDSQFESNQMPRDNRVFAANRPDLQKSSGFGVQRPKDTRELQTGRVIKDRRIFVNQNRPPLQAMGGSLDDWKAPLPQMKSAPKTDQLLPSQTRQQQTYINQLPPSERAVRPSLTGNVRRRIRPVWPPHDHNYKFIPKAGFNPSGRESPRRDWPPPRSQSFDDGNYYDDRMMSPTSMDSPKLKYANPTPGAFQQAWNPRSGSVTPPGIKSYQPSRRVKNAAWPPPSNATPAGRSGYRPQTSLPGSRRSSQAEDYLLYGANTRIPQTYRPPPGTQYFEPTYHYDTD